MAKGAKTAATHPGEEKLFINKARRFLEGARELLKQNNHEGTAVLAVHSTISSCDALTAKFLSCRHKGENHGVETMVAQASRIYRWAKCLVK